MGVNVFYDYYIFDPMSSKFEKDSALVGIADPEFDSEKKQITSYYKSGSQWYVDTFQFNGLDYDKISSNREGWHKYTNEEYRLEILIPNDMVGESWLGHGVSLTKDDYVNDKYVIPINVINVEEVQQDIASGRYDGIMPPEYVKAMDSATKNYVYAVDQKDSNNILLNFEIMKSYLLCYGTETCYDMASVNPRFLETNGYPSISFFDGENISILANGRIYRLWFSGQRETYQKKGSEFRMIIESFRPLE
jgi:hypothetical protein